MRIAVVNSIRAYGGGEKWVLQFARGMVARGHSVEVLAHPDGDLLRRCQSEGLAVSPVLLRHDLSPVAVLSLARHLRRLHPEAVICCNERAVRIAAVAGRLNGKAPLIYRNGLEGSFKNKAHNRVVVAPRIRRYVVNAEGTAAELREFAWIAPQNVSVIYNGVDPAPLEAADPAGVREELGASPDDVVVLMAARLVSEKGHALLIDAAAALADEHPRLQVWLAGDGPGAEALGAQVNAARLQDRVRLLGFRSDIPRLMRAADILCHPSRREGAPNVVLEAMAAGLPVVGMAAPGTAELVVDEVTGLLAPLNDAEGLRQRLERLIADPDLRHRLGEAGRERARSEFSIARSLDCWEALLNQVAVCG